MITVDSEGSVWFIDEEQSRYCRMPRDEEPRRPEWSQGALEDLVWHEYVSWKILVFPFIVKDRDGNEKHAGEDYLPALLIRYLDNGSEVLLLAPKASIR